MQCTLNSCSILMKLELSRQIFEKSNIRFHENTSSGSRVVPCGRMDGQTNRRDEGNSRFSQFCERAQKCAKNSQLKLYKMLEVDAYR